MRYTKENWKDSCERYFGPGRYSVPIKFTKETLKKRSKILKTSPVARNHTSKLKKIHKQKLKETAPARKRKKQTLKERALRKKRARGKPSDVLPRSADGKIIYNSVWVSTVNKRYCVTMKTLIAIKFGRPRDPWGAYMVPKNPELLFGGTLRPDQQFIVGDTKSDCFPTVQTDIPGPNVRQDGQGK